MLLQTNINTIDVIKIKPLGLEISLLILKIILYEDS